MGPTRLGKTLFIGYGLLVLIALTSWASGGQRGEQIYSTSIAIILVSFIVLYLIDRLHSRRSPLGGHLIVLWTWESNSSEDGRKEQEERERKERREHEERERQERREHEERERQERTTKENQSNEFENLENPFEILGIPKNATQEEIKTRWRELSQKFHPDKEKAKFATELMKKINWAHDVLEDPKQRMKYA